jgi:hypothetical protein
VLSLSHCASIVRGMINSKTNLLIDIKTIGHTFIIFLVFMPIFANTQTKNNISMPPNSATQQKNKVEATRTSPPGVVALEGKNKLSDPGRAPSNVDIKLLLTNQKFDLKTRLYELPSSMIDRTGESLNTTNTSRILDGARELKEGMIQMPSESYRMIAITVENNTTAPVYFHVAQHSIAPADEALGIKFVCLCNGTVYRARPKETWVRIMKLQISSANRASKFDLVHTIYGIEPGTLPKNGTILD